MAGVAFQMQLFGASSVTLRIETAVLLKRGKMNGFREWGFRVQLLGYVLVLMIVICFSCCAFLFGLDSMRGILVEVVGVFMFRLRFNALPSGCSNHG